ncbi:MAG: DUF4430 domain-containing protein [Candidatus Sigynarchaeota archaeon]
MTEQRNTRAINKKATLVLFIVSFSSLVVVYSSLTFFLGGSNRIETDRITLSNVTVWVYFKEKPPAHKEGVTSRVLNATVFDVMHDEFSIRYKQYPTGYFIEWINDAGPSWTYMVNNVSPLIACNKFVLSNDSVIVWTQE